MIEIALNINKEKVYEEVAQTTSYTGAKKDDELAYDKIFTTDEDKSMLERFWNESKNTVCASLMKVLKKESELGDTYTVTLNVSSQFDTNLTESMQDSLFSFFVTNITSKWFVMTDKEDAPEYAAQAATLMGDVKRKAFYKKAPERPMFNSK